MKNSSGILIVLGRKYHKRNFNSKKVWKLTSYDNEGNYILTTPKSKISHRAKLDELYNICKFRKDVNLKFS